MSGVAAQLGGLDPASTSPVFLAVLALHVPAGMVAVLSGATAALSRKGSARHVRAGRIYVGALGVVFATALALTALRFPRDLHLAALGTIALVAALIGRADRRRDARPGGTAATARGRGAPDDGVHLIWMGASYVVMLTAFYVDNGPNLPVWNRLPSLAFWSGPALIATPVIYRAVRRHRPVRNTHPVSGTRG